MVSNEVMVNLIRSTTTRKGLKIRAELDENEYQKGIKIADKEMAEVNIKRDDFHGDGITDISAKKLIMFRLIMRDSKCGVW